MLLLNYQKYVDIFIKNMLTFFSLFDIMKLQINFAKSKRDTESLLSVYQML